MAVGFSNTNKPFNPRGNDQSPLAFNRAKLFSGKALDFDGVNDYVQCDNLNTLSTSDFTICYAFKWESTGDNWGVTQGQGGTNQAIITGKQSSGVIRFAFWGNDLDAPANLTPAQNEWSFLSFTYNRTTKARKIYINGILAAEDVSASNPSPTANNFQISAFTAISGYYNNQVSNVKVYSTALTAAQVADLYNNPEKVVPTGVDNTALKLWLPMQEGAGTTAINGAPDALGSEQIENGNFATDSNWTKGSGWTISGGTANATSASTGTPISQYIDTGKKYRVTYDVVSLSQGAFQVDLSYSGTALGQVVTTTGTFTDVITSINPALSIRVVGTTTGSIDNVSVKELTNFGTISGATWTHGIGAPVAQTAVINWNKASDGTNEVLIPQGLTSGRDLLGNLFENVRKQGALNLDGNSWAEVHDNGSLDFGTGSFSIEAWVIKNYVNSGSSLNVIMSLGDNVGGANNTGLTVNSTNVAFKYVGYQTHNVTTGDWVHVVGVYDETNAILYVDGVAETTTARTAINVTNALTKYIGRDSTTTRNYADQIAQPRIYNRALTAEEVQRNYNAGKNTYTN